jgi:hypothetical protein
MAFIIIQFIAYLMLTVFQCTPVHSFWDKNVSGYCSNAINIVYSASAFSIFDDLLIIALPIPMVWRLKVETRKRVELLVMFGVGSL